VAAGEARPLVAYVRTEPVSIATRPFSDKGAGLHVALRMFNALLVLIDDRGDAQPELLESLPQLNTDSWRVFPDGTMQTTYTLRPNLTWHDGAPFTAADYAFAWQLYQSPELGLATRPPMHAIEDVTALDSKHFVIQWKLLFPDADTLATYSYELPPLPRHLLGPAFDQMAVTGPDPVATHAFWSRDYVGLGPYRLQKWEPGSFIDAVRFDGYALGAPKIPRIELRFSADQNVVVASLLAGDAHFASDNSLGQAAETLAERWGETKAGTVIQWPNSWRSMAFQLRPEVVNPKAIFDGRVRKAIAQAVDKQTISEAVYANEAIPSESMVWAKSKWGPALDGSIATYPFDRRASERLMNEAGYAKVGDGLFAGPDGQLTLDVVTTADPDNVREILVIADSLRAAGFEIQQRVLPAAQAQNSQIRASFPTMQISNTNMGEPAMQGLVSSQIPTAANRYLGGNRGGWTSPEYDRVVMTFNQTLDGAERVSLVRQALRLYAEDLPSVPLFFRAQPFAFAAGIKGPAVAAPESSVVWNIHEWEYRSGS